jgi:hypothetical protein
MDHLVDLATRKAGSIEVALIWDRNEEALRVFAYDALTGEELVVPVTAEEATEVYRHPFAYTRRATVVPGTSHAATRAWASR